MDQNGSHDKDIEVIKNPTIFIYKHMYFQSNSFTKYTAEDDIADNTEQRSSSDAEIAEIGEACIL